MKRDLGKEKRVELDLGNGKRVELLDPKNDYAFYWLFGRKEETRFIKDFLSALFKEEITEIEHLTSESGRTYKDGKIIKRDVDVLVRIPNKHTRVGILVANRHMDELCHHYWAKIFGEQESEDLEKAVAVNILDYVKFKQSHKYHNYFDLNERDLRTIELTDKLTAKFEIHFLELPKIELDIGKSRLLDWLIYFRYYNNREVMKDLLEANKMIRAAAIYELTDPEALKLYEAARKRELDYKSAISAAERRGIQKERQLVINRLLKKGHTLNEIREMTGYDRLYIG